MIEIRPNLWRGVSVVALAAGLVACAPGDTGKSDPNAPAAAAVPTPPPAASAAPAGEAGEAGAGLAYDGLSPEARAQLRYQHLKGFVLIARKELEAGHAPEAGALIGQGVLEVYTPGATDLGDFDVTPVKAASELLLDAKPEAKGALDAALAAISARQGPADAVLVRKMLRVCAGLANAIVVDGGVDPIEYQHSYGAALSVKDAFERAEPTLRRQNAARAAEARQEIDRLLQLWPATQAPESVAPSAQYAAQIARVELALSGL